MIWRRHLSSLSHRLLLLKILDVEQSSKRFPFPKIKKESLGSVALALLPLEKLKNKSPRLIPFEKEIHDFLSTTFNGYTVHSGNISGYWKDDLEVNHYGEHRAYKVALPNKDARETFELFLATLAHEMDETCIYIEVAGEITLIYAKNLSRK
jgi:hypothetical protein